MGGLDVPLDLGQQGLDVFCFETLPAPALDDGCHPVVKTAQPSPFFPFAASA